jgi:hypothetical protein
MTFKFHLKIIDSHVRFIGPYVRFVVGRTCSDCVISIPGDFDTVTSFWKFEILE